MTLKPDLTSGEPVIPIGGYPRGVHISGPAEELLAPIAATVESLLENGFADGEGYIATFTLRKVNA